MDPPPSSDVLLAWSKEQTRGYRGVNITDFSLSWKDGLALCALVHSLDKSQFQYDLVMYQPLEQMLNTAFNHASKIGIPQLLGVSDLMTPTPDQLAIETYLHSIYHHWLQHQHRQEEKQLAQQLLAQEHKDDHVQKELTLLSEKNMQLGKVLLESQQIKEKLDNVEEELDALHDTIEQSEKHNELVQTQISQKSAQLEDTIEKERQQYEIEIERLHKELEELKKHGPSDEQLALKRRLDEQREKKDRLNKMKQQMEQEIQNLKAQLEQDEQQRIQLQARRVDAERRRVDLRLKHKDELQKLQRDLYDNFGAEDKLQTDLLQQNYVKNSLQAETTKLNTEVKSLDNTHTGLVKQNTELKEKRQKLEAQLLGAKLYLEEETRLLNFKDVVQSDLQQQKKLKAAEREKTYDAKRVKDKEYRKVASELAGAKDTYDKEYLHNKQMKKAVSKLEITSDILKSEHDEEKQNRAKKVQQLKEANKIAIEKEDSKHRVKVEAVVAQTASLAANSADAKLALQAEKAKIEEMRERTDELSHDLKSAVHSINTEASSIRDAGRAQDNLKKALQFASDLLAEEKHTKSKTSRAKHKAEDNIKSINDALVQSDSKKSAVDNAKDHLARDYELTKQDLKQAEKEAKKAKEEKQKLGEEREKLKQDIVTEDEKYKPKQQIAGSDNHNRNADPNGTIEKLKHETDLINDKTESLKRETAKLEDDKAKLQFEQTQAKIIKESDKHVLAQDRKALKKLQEHRDELKTRLEAIQKNITQLPSADTGDLVIERDFVLKRLDDVENKIRDQIKQM